MGNQDPSHKANKTESGNVNKGSDLHVLWFKHSCTAMPKDLTFYLWRCAVKGLSHDMTFVCALDIFLQQK